MLLSCCCTKLGYYSSRQSRVDAALSFSEKWYGSGFSLSNARITLKSGQPESSFAQSLGLATPIPHPNQKIIVKPSLKRLCGNFDKGSLTIVYSIGRNVIEAVFLVTVCWFRFSTFKICSKNFLHIFLKYNIFEFRFFYRSFNIRNTNRTLRFQNKLKLLGSDCFGFHWTKSLLNVVKLV
jgi:hypothetical protein